jgi:hypothetical protein
MSDEVLRIGGVVMATELHGIPEEITVGDVVETVIGVGVVTRVSKPVQVDHRAMLEIDLGRKWLSVDRVRSILRHKGEEPGPGWDEHE